MPARLLALGAGLQQHATPELKKWVKSYVKKEFKELPADSTAPAAAAAQRFPAASSEGRGAVVFLLFHTGYVEEGETQKRLEGEIHDIDRWIDELQWRPPERAERSTPTYGDRRRGLQVDRLQRDRKMKAAALETSRQRANAYLNLLLAQYPSLKDTTPAAVQTLK